MHLYSSAIYSEYEYRVLMRPWGYLTDKIILIVCAVGMGGGRVGDRWVQVKEGTQRVGLKGLSIC